MLENNQTQADLVLNDLKQGRTMTPLDALERHGVFRLAAVIYDLKKHGYDIRTDIIHNKRTGKKYANYVLNSL